jgi:hypothetical protein
MLLSDTIAAVVAGIPAAHISRITSVVLTVAVLILVYLLVVCVLFSLPGTTETLSNDKV